MENRRRKSATVEDTGGGSSSLDDSDGSSARERLKTRFLAELYQRRRHEQTARQLQRNYDDLLRSHAEKELAIEQLRLGARVSLTLESPAPGHAVSGAVPGPQRAVLFSVPKAGVATVAAMSTSAPQTATLAPATNNSLFTFSLFILYCHSIYLFRSRRTKSGKIRRLHLTNLFIPCHSQRIIVHRPLDSIQLCLELPPSSSSSCT